jgi:hypothetical protein
MNKMKELNKICFLLTFRLGLRFGFLMWQRSQNHLAHVVKKPKSTLDTLGCNLMKDYM